MTAVERLDDIEIRLLSPMVTYKENATEDVPALVAALRAVLEVHSPLITDGGWVCATCALCLDDATPECPTVRAITAALDVTS